MIKKKRSWLWGVLYSVVVLVGIVLIFNQQIKQFLIKQSSDGAARQTLAMTRKQLAKNNRGKGTYHYDSVKALDLSTVTRAALLRGLKPIGLVSVPSVGISLPIMKGITNRNLAVGAATMKPGQVMGERNYALAGHHIHGRGLLFSPLERFKTGSKVYITDLNKVYVYKITLQKVVDKTQGQYIDDVPNEKLITLVTCASDYEGQRIRQVLQGQLVDTEPATDASLRVFEK